MKRNWLLVAVLAIGIAVLLVILRPRVFPSESERDQSARVECLQKVHAIGRAMRAYAEAHDGMYPQTLGALLKEGFITDPRAFLCPGTQGGIPTGFPKDLRNADIGALDKIEEFGGYVLVRGLRFEGRPDVIVLFDKPGNHPENDRIYAAATRVCLFDDGSDKLLLETEFEERMRAQEAEVRNAGGK